MDTQTATPATAAPATGTTAPATSPAPSTPGVAFGTPSSGSTEGTATTPASTPDPWAGLTPENLQVVKNKNWSDINAAVKSYAELERARGSAPAEAPKDLSAYTFGKPESLPEGVNYSDEFANSFKEWALSAKVQPDAAKTIHDSFVDWSSKQALAAREAMTNRIAETKSQLNKAWGPDESPNFGRQIELSARAAEKLGIMDSLKSVGAIVDVGGKTLVADAKLAQALAQVGNAMFAEDSIHGVSTSTVNPFDPKSENLQLQGQIYKQDPQKAKALIYAAGQQDRFAYLLSTIK